MLPSREGARPRQMRYTVPTSSLGEPLHPALEPRNDTIPYSLCFFPGQKSNSKLLAREPTRAIHVTTSQHHDFIVDHCHFQMALHRLTWLILGFEISDFECTLWEQSAFLRIKSHETHDFRQSSFRVCATRADRVIISPTQFPNFEFCDCPSSY